MTLIGKSIDFSSVKWYINTDMWDRIIAQPLGHTSRRGIFSFAMAMLVAVFGILTLSSQPVAAAADVTWNAQNNLIYQGKEYVGPDANIPSGISSGNPIREASATYALPTDDGEVSFIYFAKDTDPQTATSAYLMTTQRQDDRKELSVQPQAESTGEESGTKAGATSCTLSGIGWLVCPISNALANGVDFLFTALGEFMKVKPITSDQSGVIYRGWKYMQSFANIAFVIAFLFIIYSQVTSFGLSNYGIKRLLPRIVIAAVLMNTSYWICAIAVDLSNILGISLENMFMNLRDGLMTEGQKLDLPTWQSVTTSVLAGGGLVFGGLAIYATEGAVIALLLPSLLMVALSALVAIVILAARQAIITCLIIISPLAFVAFLLPNTDKYFHKWRELLMTMLLLFPIFSVIFGGAQLAGGAIIATSHSIVELIFGMAIQVVPLAITPLLLRFSGSLLGSIAGIINSRQKGLVDRSRNWARGAVSNQMIRAGSRSRYRNRMASGFLNWQDDKAKREERYKARRANMYNSSRRGIRNAEVMSNIQTDARRIEAEHELHLKARLDPNDVRFERHAFERHLNAEIASDHAELAKQRAEVTFSEIRAGHRPVIQGLEESEQTDLNDVYNHFATTSQDIALTSMRKKMSDRKQNSELASALIANQEMRNYAGGILGQVGAEAALASAVATERKEYNENVESKKQLIKHFNLSGLQRQNLAKRVDKDLVATKNGETYHFDVADEHAVDAAIEMQMAGMGSAANIQELIALSGDRSDTGLYDFRTTISNMIVDGKVGAKMPYFSGVTIDDVSQGRIQNMQDVSAALVRAAAKGKYSPAHLATMDAVGAETMWKTLSDRSKIDSDYSGFLSADDKAVLDRQLIKVGNNALEALTDENLKGNITDASKPYLMELWKRYADAETVAKLSPKLTE